MGEVRTALATWQEDRSMTSAPGPNSTVKVWEEWEQGPGKVHQPTKNWAPNEPNGKAREPCSNNVDRANSDLPVRASGYWNDLPCGVIAVLGLVCQSTFLALTKQARANDQRPLKSYLVTGHFKKKSFKNKVLREGALSV
ncbi:hypothetical protein OS493_005813 [Desmophyllum pertusum]|uniref:Uncharacterized protein n=1 Tax=Desmophyllum pertusum TaxID=174260 RepID=A0A9W9YF97_9CNID|nr:hypothetical protein OS493_005813 [Desmophyllum pertusum]